MRARIKFTSDVNKDLLIGILREHHWWPHFGQNSAEAKRIITDVQDSLQENDIELFDGSEKVVLSHTPTESSGTLSLEHSVWVVRLLNPNVHLLQLSCETLVNQVVGYASLNHKKIVFVGPVQIVERNRKETIIDGRTLATQQDRMTYAKSHRPVEFLISWAGAATLVTLLLLTYPWSWRDPSIAWETWLFSIFEKFIGSVAVTTLISYFQYRSFRNSLKDHAIHWSIPGEPERLDVSPSIF